MQSFDQAKSAILSKAEQWFSSRDRLSYKLEVEQAFGQVLAQSIEAPINVPNFANSAMDGIAFSFADVDLSQPIDIGLTVYAGQNPASLKPGKACRIFTGAALPEGADTVILQEDCDFTDDLVSIKLEQQSSAFQGQHVRQIGEDLRRGQHVLNKGCRISAAEIGLLSSLGIRSVAVYKPLSIALVSTGDELIDASIADSQDLEKGQIFNSNGPMLANLLSRHYCQVQRHHVADDLDATLALFDSLANEVDLIITIGGVSVGDADFVKQAIDKLGHIDFWKVAMKPGKPFALGQVKEVPLLGLPGNPVSAFASMQLFALPFIAALQGVAREDKLDEYYPVLLAKSLQPRREEFLRVKKVFHDNKIYLQPYSHQGSGVLSSVVFAEGFARITNDGETSSGDLVRFVPFSV